MQDALRLVLRTQPRSSAKRVRSPGLMRWREPVQDIPQKSSAGRRNSSLVPRPSFRQIIFMLISSAAKWSGWLLLLGGLGSAVAVAQQNRDGEPDRTALAIEALSRLQNVDL